MFKLRYGRLVEWFLRACLPAWLLLTATAPVSGQYMFWTYVGPGAIRRANLDGTNVVDIPVGGLSTPFGIGIDLTTNIMYWTDEGTDRLRRANLDGTGAQDLVNFSSFSSSGVGIDPVGGRVYWTETSPPMIRRANLDGTDVQTLVNTGLGDPRFLAINLNLGRIYWADQNQGQIMQRNFDGSNRSNLVGGSSPFGVAVDPATGRVFWGNRGGGTIQRVDSDGGNLQTLVSGLGDPWDMEVDSLASKLYYIDRGNGLIRRIGLDGSSPETLVTGQGGALGIALVAQPPPDCNSNTIPDEDDLAQGTSVDCNTNDVPDECDAAGSTSDDCDSNVVPDECQPDCNTNDVADVCDGSPDCNSNGVPDECEQDCNTNGIPDACDILAGASEDCPPDGNPDECQNNFYFWTGPDGGLFTTPGNWNPVGPPYGNAILANGGAVDNRAVLNAPGEQTVCTLTVEASGTGRQILEIDAGSGLIALGGSDVNMGGTIELRGGNLGGETIANNSNSIIGYGRLSANVANQGLIEARLGDAHILRFTGGAFENQSAGLLRVAVASVALVDSSSVSQAGQIEVRSLAAAVFAAPLTNAPGGDITVLGGTLDANTLVNGAGATLTATGTIDADVLNQGHIILIADTLVVGDLENDGTITIQSGILTVTGNLSGTGTIVGGFGG